METNVAAPLRRHALILLVLLGVAAAAGILSGNPQAAGAGGLGIDLPARVGEWEGRRVFFCQSSVCDRSFPEDEVGPDHVCPACGGPLEEWSIAERAILPGDTQVRRRQYRNARGDAVQVSVVISGVEQKSIHRPQQCLPAQGQVIEATEVLDVPRPGGVRHLTGLRLRRAGDTAGRGGWYYAYWFTDGRRETPSHFRRLWWMSWDRIVRGTAHPWAYIGLFTSRDAFGDAHIRRLQEFLSQWEPVAQ